MCLRDKEVQELITQDVDRTMQEINLFTIPIIKEHLEDLLYLWAKDNNDFSYRQGMNEILAIVVIAYFQEFIENDKDSQTSGTFVFKQKCNE